MTDPRERLDPRNVERAREIRAEHGNPPPSAMLHRFVAVRESMKRKNPPRP